VNNPAADKAGFAAAQAERGIANLAKLSEAINALLAAPDPLNS
jgi:hypothetical protein